MKRLINKLIVIILLQIICNIAIISFALTNDGISHQTALIVETLIIVLSQIPIYFTYKFKALNLKKYKITYWIFSICCTLITAWFWLIYVVGPLWH